MRSTTADTIHPTTADHSTATLVRIAAVVVLADLISKQVAVARLGGGSGVALGDAVRLTLFHNHGLAWGLSGWGQALGITLAGSALLLLAVAAVQRRLAVVDPSSPRMLGLIVGAAIGNAASLFLWPAGAPDFIAIDTGGGSEAVINVADVALFVGLALCCRTTWRVALAVRAERERRPSLVPVAVAAAAVVAEAPVMLADGPPPPPSGRERTRPVEREVPLDVAREDGYHEPLRTPRRPSRPVADRDVPRLDDFGDPPLQAP